MMTTKVKSTKQLARELGLLRKRSLSEGTPMGNKKQKPDLQKFSHLIVMDFESTCWENDKTMPQEIIEFPAVLLNCQSGEIESEFQYYVQPTENPFLSDFCKQLTGISQDLVDDGIPLSICLRKFLFWLKKLQKEKGIECANDKNLALQKTDGMQTDSKLAAFVTWSDWDLGVCLLYETKRKQILRPLVLDRWIDLRASYRKFYSRRPDGLNGALKDLGITFDGREHSGLDDARNTAKLAHRMICDGCMLDITKTLKSNQSLSMEKIPNPLTVTMSKAATPGKTNSDSAEEKKEKKMEGKSHDKSSIHSRAKSPASNKTPSDPSLVFSSRLSSDGMNSSKSNLKVHSCVTPSDKSGPMKLSVRNTNLPLSSRIKTLHKDLSSNEKSPCKSKISTPFKSYKSVNLSTTSKTPVINKAHLKQSRKTPTKFQEKALFPSPTSLTSAIINDIIPQSNISASRPKTLSHLSISNGLKHRPTSGMTSALRVPSKTPSSVLSMPFKTPSPADAKPAMKATPPLCSCGRRSKRRYVQTPGPNIGRTFFSCPISNSSCGTVKSKGCSYFKWEVTSSRNVHLSIR